MNYIVLSIDYVAGFIDGEGCIGLYYVPKDASLPSPVISIGSANRSIILGLKSTFDAWEISSGVVNKRGVDRKYKPQYLIQVSSQNSIRKLLSMLIPSLTIKQREAQILFDYLEKRRFFPKNQKPNKDFKEFAQKTVDDLKMLKQQPF